MGFTGFVAPERRAGQISWLTRAFTRSPHFRGDRIDHPELFPLYRGPGIDSRSPVQFCCKDIKND